MDVQSLYLRSHLFCEGEITIFIGQKSNFSVHRVMSIFHHRIYSKALSTRAGMPVGHCQLFTFFLASEAVLPDNPIVLALHFRSCPPLPFPPCVLEPVMGTVFARRARPIVWTGLSGLLLAVSGSATFSFL